FPIKQRFINNQNDIYTLSTFGENVLQDSLHSVIRINSQLQTDTCFTFKWNHEFEFMTTTPTGFIFHHRFQPSDFDYDCYYQYNNNTKTYTRIAMPDARLTSGIEYQNGALFDGLEEFFFNDARPTNIKFVDANGAVQGWSDPTFIAPEYMVKGDKGVFFSVQQINPISGASEYSIQKLVAPNVFSKLANSQKFYLDNGFGGFFEVKPRLLAICRDYLYAYAPDKIDNVNVSGYGYVRLKLLNQNNLPPVAVGDVFQATDTASMVLTMRANDSDPNGDYLYAEIIKAGKGTAELMTNYDIEYRAPLYFSGNDTIVYRTCDQGGLCSQPAQIIVQVSASGVQPVAVDDIAQTYQSIVLKTDISINDDYQDKPYSMNIAQNAKHGMASKQGDTIIRYTPNASFVGLDSVEYSICRAYGYCDTAMVYIAVEEHPNAPITAPDYVSLTGTHSLVYPLNNDSNPTGGTLSYKILDGPFAQGASLNNVNQTNFFYVNTNFASVEKDSVLYEACNVSNKCQQEWVYFSRNTAGLNQSDASFTFVVYPNPAHDQAHLQLSAHLQGSIDILLWDATGRELLRLDKKNTAQAIEFSTAHLAPGLYRIGIAQNGNILKVKNITKE
ncbi:MAG: T9SS type A sorting domain-containing protein, partial [Bacteroidetes bacterium]|nr:T9SS type A sorting domain-containing protein [Bacteroidota bacterium]